MSDRFYGGMKPQFDLAEAVTDDLVVSGRLNEWTKYGTVFSFTADGHQELRLGDRVLWRDGVAIREDRDG